MQAKVEVGEDVYVILAPTVSENLKWEIKISVSLCCFVYAVQCNRAIDSDTMLNRYELTSMWIRFN